MSFVLAIKILLTLFVTMGLNLFFVKYVDIGGNPNLKSKAQMIIAGLFFFHLFAIPAALINLIWSFM